STGAIANYHWDWDDETSSDTATATTSHAYAYDATFAIHLRVTDASGSFADVTHAVTVTSPPSGPTAAFTSSCVNRACSVNGSASTGTISNYHWDWGDETSTDSASPTASHTYASDGTFSIHLRVTDASGQFGDATHNVTVQLPPQPSAVFTTACT